MKNIFLLIAFLASFLVKAVEGDTTVVYVHQNVDMTWYANYDRVGVFPTDSTKVYRKVWMHYTMGCATGGCSDWDYTTQMFLMHRTGNFDSSFVRVDTISSAPLVVDSVWNVYEVLDPFELGRVITPYGSQLQNTWTREYIFDVTDLKHLMQDSVLIRAFYSGWSSGFSVSLKFVFIEGTPTREVLSVQNIYKGDAGYSNSASFESGFFNAKSIQIPSGFTGARVFSTITGHGFDNNVNCAEFCIRNYNVNVNGNNAGTANIWRDDCGSNPTYPQGGTWIYDRANWCPGEKAFTDEFEVGNQLNAGANAIDFNLQNYNWTGNQAPSYTVNARIVTYGPIQFQNDAYLLEILAPTTDFQHSRYNPICAQPKVKVQNTGANNISSITFLYRVEGASSCQYTWNGNLSFLQKADIELPNINWVNADFSNQKFYVEILSVNGQNDEYTFNNSLWSNYNTPNIHNFDTMFVELRTNNYGTETGYQLLNGDGQVVFQRVATSLTANTTYLDRIGLPRGCYTLKVTDSGKDGLRYWADPAAGSGLIRISRFIPQFGIYVPVRDFESEFGNFIHYPFIVGPTKANIDDNMTNTCTITSIENESTHSFSSSIYPNPNAGSFYLDIETEKESEIRIKVYNAMGQELYNKTMEASAAKIEQLQLNMDAKGLYFVQVESKGYQVVHKVRVE